MIWIAHRINTVKELHSIHSKYGVEIDLRDRDNKIIMSHDPFIPGEDFEEYIKKYNHSLLILNIKSEGIEFKVKKILEKFNVSNYFFLDSSFSMIFRLMEINLSNIAVRASEVESFQTIYNFNSQVDWVWVDCFKSLVLPISDYKRMKSMGYKICLTSPDLLGRDNEIMEMADYFKKHEIQFDAICCKIHNIHHWKKCLDLN